MTKRCGNGAIWTSWAGARHSAHPRRVRTARSMASTWSVCLGHQQCPVRVNLTPRGNGSNGRLAATRSRERFRKAVYFHLGNWTSTQDSHPYQMHKPPLVIRHLRTLTGSRRIGLLNTSAHKIHHDQSRVETQPLSNIPFNGEPRLPHRPQVWRRRMGEGG